MHRWTDREKGSVEILARIWGEGSKEGSKGGTYVGESPKSEKTPVEGQTTRKVTRMYIWELTLKPRCFGVSMAFLTGEFRTNRKKN